MTQTVNSGTLSTTSVLTSSPNPSSYGTSVTFTDTVLGLFGHANRHGDLLQLHHLGVLAPRPRSGPGRSTARARPPSRPRRLPVGTTYVEAVYGASGNYGGSTSNVVTQVVNALSTTSVLTSSPNPSTYGTSVTFTDTVSATSGTPSGTVTFYSCTTSACSHQDLARDRDAQQLGQGHLLDLEPAGGHHLRRGGLRGLGQLRRLDLERGDPGGQRALDHLGPHLVAQPVDLRLLGDLHRHGARPLRARRAAR